MLYLTCSMLNLTCSMIPSEDLEHYEKSRTKILGSFCATILLLSIIIISLPHQGNELHNV